MQASKDSTRIFGYQSGSSRSPFSSSLLHKEFCTWDGFCGLVLFICQSKTSPGYCEQLYCLHDSSLAHSLTLSTSLFLPKPHSQMAEHRAPPPKSVCRTPLYPSWPGPPGEFPWLHHSLQAIVPCDIFPQKTSSQSLTHIVLSDFWSLVSELPAIILNGKIEH